MQQLQSLTHAFDCGLTLVTTRKIPVNFEREHLTPNFATMKCSICFWKQIILFCHLLLQKIPALHRQVLKKVMASVVHK